MKILVTGTTGYIAQRLLPILIQEGHEIVCTVRDYKRIPEKLLGFENISFIEVDFLVPKTLRKVPKDIAVAYYLMHSMSKSSSNFTELEQQCATNFKNEINKTEAQQVIYLSGIVNEHQLSKHLASRHNVEILLKSTHYALTTFRAGIIVGSGSASFEIIRDLVEKLPVMVAPKWLNTKTQPIAIRDVLSYLSKAMLNRKTYNQSFDIFGPEVLTYRQMLMQFAQVRGLNRWIITLPILSPKTSSYWLYFVTSTSYNLATALVQSMKVPIIGKVSNINTILDITPITYWEALKKAFVKIEQNSIVSSWKDAVISSNFNQKLSSFINLPQFGCLKDIKTRTVLNEGQTLDNIWSLGGERGWYYGNWMWQLRGLIDKVFGGIGLRRGRTHTNELQSGDALDFWRVLYANKKEKRLLLYAEMKLPGEAWLEYKIIKNKLYQRAIFRPKGISGRLYWLSVLPFHYFIFNGLINKLIHYKS